MALVLAPEPPVEDWLDALDAQIKRSPSFFVGRPVVLDLGALPSEQPDVAGLLQRLTPRHPHHRHRGRASILAGAGALGAAARQRHAPCPAARRARRTAAPDAGARRRTSLLIDQPVRSGQSIIFPQGDVTIVGSVASGAEVIAGGSIHVYGALRGRAIAGPHRQRRARIFCRKLEAELLAIDGLYQTADDMSAALRGKPVQAWLDGDAMMLAALD